MRYLIPLALLALAGCASTPDANYSAYIEAHNRVEQQRAVAEQALADAAACNGDTACVISVKAIAGLTMQGGGNRSQIAPPPRKVHWSEAFANVSGGLHPLGQIWGMVEGGRNNVEIARIGAERDARRDETYAGMTLGIANAFALQAPGTHVEGDLISGTQTIVGGDQVSGTQTIAGRDQIGGDQYQGDWRTGNDTRRDTIGRDRTDYGNGNRLDSPGPFELNDVGNRGNRCTGMDCQTVNPPDPEPEE